MRTEDPVLSVVVALTAGENTDLARCLESLTRQENAPSVEVIVPWDPPREDVRSLAERFPDVSFIPVPMDSAAARAGASREHHDTLRKAGIDASRGRIVALTEDHSVVGPTWCADAVRLVDEHPEAGAVGGPVDCRPAAMLSFATWLCDFGRFGSPLPDGPARYVSDTNVAYPRAALDAVADAWSESYRETVVHGALLGAGRTLVLAHDLRSWQVREDLALLRSLRERRIWGRSYAGTRVRGRPLLLRLAYAAFTPLLPLLLTWRHLAGSVRRGKHVGKTLLLVPLLLLLETSWSLGECVGYVTGRPSRA